MATPKILIATGLPNVGYAVSSASATQRSGLWNIPSALPKLSESSSDEDSSVPHPTRKRQRLDHLTLEEKILRRKLKNREAAQSARDRKKARMDELENEVKKLKNQMSMLQKENRSLIERNSRLEEENAQLKRRLGLIDIPTDVKQETKQEAASSPEKVSCPSLEYASLINVPLQKGQDRQILSPLMMQFACLWVMMNVMSCLIFYKSMEKSSWSVTSLPEVQGINQKESSKFHQCHNSVGRKDWWGPHQRNWNPSKN